MLYMTFNTQYEIVDMRYEILDMCYVLCAMRYVVCVCGNDDISTFKYKHRNSICRNRSSRNSAVKY